MSDAFTPVRARRPPTEPGLIDYKQPRTFGTHLDRSNPTHVAGATARGAALALTLEPDPHNGRSRR
jgi:hypothetical protein